MLIFDPEAACGFSMAITADRDPALARNVPIG
jgi:hypothetical protein